MVMLNSNELHAAAHRLMALGPRASTALHDAVRRSIELRSEFLGLTDGAEAWVKEGWRLFTERHGSLSPTVVQVVISLDRDDIRIEDFIAALQRLGFHDWERALRCVIREAQFASSS